MSLNKNLIDLNHISILVTGAAGFIGANLILQLLKEGNNNIIIGVDNLNTYYDIRLKKYRLHQIMLKQVQSNNHFEFIEMDITDSKVLLTIFRKYQPAIVVNLAAQAGVRYSITNPKTYIENNVTGFFQILEACRDSSNEYGGVKHLIFASSSSVYGENKKVPFSENDFVDHPVSLYAATKKTNELFAYSYAKLYGIPCTGLRFFTVYGPAGRPDMAYFSFTNKLVNREKISIYNYGNCARDFTYIDDITEGIIRVMENAPKINMTEESILRPPYEIYNIGNNHPQNVMDFVHVLSEELIRADILPNDFDIESYIKLVPMQKGDVPVTFANTDKLEQACGFKPSTDLRIGLRAFAEWYKKFYHV